MMIEADRGTARSDGERTAFACDTILDQPRWCGYQPIAALVGVWP